MKAKTKIAQLRPRTNESHVSKVRLTVRSRGSQREFATNTSSTLGFNRSTFIARILPSFILLLLSVAGYYFFFIINSDLVLSADHLPADKGSNYSAKIHPPLQPQYNNSKVASRTKDSAFSLETVEAKFLQLNISQLRWSRGNYDIIAKLHKVVLQGKITIYWKSTVNLKDSKGIVLLLSSCHGTGLEWWSADDTPTFDFDSSKSLPAENNIAKAFVKHGYWVVSMPAIEKRKSSGCWVNEDYVHVATAVNFMQLLRQRYALESTELPLHILGIMNGGVLVSNNIIRWQSLSLPLVFSSVTLMNCGIWNRDYEKNALNYPPVLFIDYHRNGDLALHNNQTVTKLQKVGIPAKHLSSDPLPLTPDFFATKLFHQRFNTTTEESQKLYEVMFDADFIWPGSGVLVNDVVGDIHLAKLQRLLQKTLPRVYPKLDSLQGIFSPTLQILRQAWGFRETNDEFAQEMVSWLESHTLLPKLNKVNKINSISL